jgi:hypothetical protein
MNERYALYIVLVNKFRRGEIPYIELRSYFTLEEMMEFGDRYNAEEAE